MWETKWTSATTRIKKELESERKRMRVIWSLLHGDNCVGDRKKVMMMKCGLDSASLFM